MLLSREGLERVSKTAVERQEEVLIGTQNWNLSPHTSVDVLGM